MSNKAAYLLSAELHGHTADVRGVATASVEGGDLVLSGSRDGSGRLWHRPRPEPSQVSTFALATELTGHRGFVNAVAFWRHANNSLFAVTAGQDKSIRVHSIAHAGGAVAAAHDPATVLTGHSENVCALATGSSPSGERWLVSASWDKTAKVWREDGACVATLKGHEMAVWAVLVLPSGQVVTASADKTIRLWDPLRPQAPLAVFMGHTDAVRGLALLSSSLFGSCGNDGTISLYDFTGARDDTVNRPIQTLSGHTSFVYSLSPIPGSEGELVSSGEDRSVRVWSASGSVVQTITLPAISVWSVATLSDGDLVTATNDAVVRVFSRDPTHKASAEEIQLYEASVASQELNKAQIGDVKVSQLPGQEALQVAGKSEGDVKMVCSADGTKGEAYQWSLGSWQKVGDVVGGVGKKQKQLFDGKEWDYVFDVDVQEGAPPLKLPYNSDENAYFAAQRFLDRNELPASFLEQVVQFIDQNTDGASTQVASGFRDPYTGSSSYSPAQTGTSGTSTRNPGSASGSNFVDPFTGPGMYRPAASGQSSASVASGPGGRNQILPQNKPLEFPVFNSAPVKAKLSSLAVDVGSSDALTVLTEVVDKIGASGRLSDLDLNVLESNLFRWPAQARFPLLDSYRRAVLGFSNGFDVGHVARTAFQAADWGSWGSSPPSKVQETNAMLALRAVANALAAARATGGSHLLTITELMLASQSGLLGTKNARVALATVVLNLTIVANLSDQATMPPEAGPQVLQLTTAALASEMERSTQADSESSYRLVVAAGTLATGSASGSLPVESVMVVKEVAIALSEQFRSEQRFVDVLNELKSM